MRVRNNNISFRLNDDEKIMFDNYQSITGLPKNQLIIKILSGATLAPKECTEELKLLNRNTAYLYEQVKRIGVNVNQLARVANANGATADIDILNEFNTNLLSLQKECENLWRYTNLSMLKML